jgi:hypothetical protein
MLKTWFARAIMALGLGTMMLGGSSAQAGFTLQDLINGTYGPIGDATHNSITVGDKVFADFSLKNAGIGMPLANAITVTPEGSLVTNDIGLEFQGAFGAIANGGATDDLIRYSVTVTDPTFKITDAHMFGNPNAAAGGSIVVVDSFSLANNNNPIPGEPQLNIHAVFGGSTVTSDSANFTTGYSKLFVSKDIAANSQYVFTDPVTGVVTLRNDGAPSMSFVDQRYSQTRHVPEPASFALVGLGLIATGIVGYRRRKMAQ